MRPITQVDNGFSKPDRSFTDHIVMIVSRYLYNSKDKEKKYFSPSDQVTSSARELNWEVKRGSATEALVMHVVTISNYTTPLRREDNWDNNIVSAAVAEYKP